MLEEKISHRLTRPVGRPSKTRIKRFHEAFEYQAASWSKPRQVVAKIEWHPGELFARVGYIVHLPFAPKELFKFYNQRGTAERHIKEGKTAITWTRCPASGSGILRSGFSYTHWPITSVSSCKA